MVTSKNVLLANIDQASSLPVSFLYYDHRKPKPFIRKKEKSAEEFMERSLFVGIGVRVIRKK
jgi:hypothetical protein